MIEVMVSFRGWGRIEYVEGIYALEFRVFRSFTRERGRDVCRGKELLKVNVVKSRFTW